MRFLDDEHVPNLIGAVMLVILLPILAWWVLSASPGSSPAGMPPMSMKGTMKVTFAGSN